MSVAFDHYRMNTAPQESTTLPPESPLAMPTQSLRGETLSRRWLPTSPARIGQRRALVMGGALLLTAIGTWQMHLALSSGGLLLLEAVLLGLFTALFAWIAFGFTTTLAGFFLVISRREVNSPEDLHLNEPPPKLRTRTALLMPIYNEDAQRLMAGLQAICESLDSTGRLRHFDFFVLSDTRKPELVQAEEAAFNALRERLGPDARVYYRHREENLGRKAGNIAEWVRRFGGAYEHMLILDADSLMSGRTLVRLASAMERHPRVALIQTLPLIVNGRSVFARMQQFAGRVYGPVMAYGHAWWMGAESNYWGHNAIIRTRAFAAHAGLPELGGQRPFSGSVLSHDFVEAALMRRGGWALHLAPGLSGSYEEGPPSLTDMLIRDRRWAQGNLQHGGVIGSDGLHPVSRMHLLMGIGNYLTAPAWAMLMLVGLAIPLQARLAGESMLLAGVETQRFLGVFGVTVLVLLLPKFLGYLATLSYTRLRRGCGGTWRCLLSMVLETASASLLAPITMYVQSRGTASILAGEDSGWEAQRRDDGSVPLAGLARRYGGVTGFGLLFAGIAWVVSPQMMLWMLPVLVGMVFSVPIVALTSSNTLGQWLRKRQLLQTPEEIQPPPVLARASQLRRELASAAE